LETADIVARHVLCDNLGLRSEMSLEKIAHTVEQLLDDMPRRIEMSRSGKAAVDGRGAMRTARAIVDKYKELDQRGRNATER
jgi:hypothetical protein